MGTATQPPCVTAGRRATPTQCPHADRAAGHKTRRLFRPGNAPSQGKLGLQLWPSAQQLAPQPQTRAPYRPAHRGQLTSPASLWPRAGNTFSCCRRYSSQAPRASPGCASPRAHRARYTCSRTRGSLSVMASSRMADSSAVTKPSVCAQAQPSPPTIACLGLGAGGRLPPPTLARSRCPSGRP